MLQETGLGLARRTEQEAGSEESQDPNDDANGAKGFFLADGTPNIRLRRSVNKHNRLVSYLYVVFCHTTELFPIRTGHQSRHSRRVAGGDIRWSTESLLRGYLVNHGNSPNDIWPLYSMLSVLLMRFRCGKVWRNEVGWRIPTEPL